MFIILVRIYVLFLAFILWFFATVKVNAYKFKAINWNIEKYTKFFLFLIMLLTVLWFSLIFYLKYKIEVVKVDEAKVSENVYY
jgi:hypothetical protein